MPTTETQFLNPALVAAIVGTVPKGQFFNVTFIKKDGSTRAMTCQTGVRKHVKGTGKSPSEYNPALIGVYEKDDESYKSFSKNRVISLKVMGATINPTD